MRRDQILPQQRIIGRPILRGVQVTDVACMHRAARCRSRQTHLRMSRMPEHDGADREVSCARKAAKGSEPALASQIRTYKAGSPDASGVCGRRLFSRRSASSARASQARAILKSVSLSFAFIFSAIRTQSQANSRQVLESDNVVLRGSVS
jgi:hypothetical protein